MTLSGEDEKFLREAIVMAGQSVAQGGFPAGAVIVKDKKIVGCGLSIGNVLNDPTSHGEIAAIRDACRNLQTTDLSDCVLYDSMEPCLMCFGASVWSGISKIIFACAKDAVPPAYYRAHYHAAPIIPITIIHGASLQDASLKILREWEKTNGIT